MSEMWKIIFPGWRYYLIVSSLHDISLSYLINFDNHAICLEYEVRTYKKRRLGRPNLRNRMGEIVMKNLTLEYQADHLPNIFLEARRISIVHSIFHRDFTDDSRPVALIYIRMLKYKLYLYSRFELTTFLVYIESECIT